MKEWYTLHTRPNAEYQVATALQRRELEVYLPEVETPAGPRQGRREPFFPCYLFLKIDFDVMSISQVQWTPGLRRVLACGDRPVPVANDIIEFIRLKLGATKAGESRPAPAFQPGDTVRITSGPFRDMLAIFEGPTTPNRRVQVLLSILGRASRVRVELADLKKAWSGTEPNMPRPRRTRGRGRRIKGPA